MIVSEVKVSIRGVGDSKVKEVDCGSEGRALTGN